MFRRIYDKPAAALVMAAAVIVLGIIQYFNLPIALYPKTSRPKIIAWLGTGSTGAESFRDRYGTDLIEPAIVGIDGVDKVEASYRNGWVQFVVEFEWNTESDVAKQEVRAALSPIEANFPKEWGSFSLWFDGADSGQVFVSLYSDKFSPDRLAEIAEGTLIPAVERIEGMEETFLSRFDQRYVAITLNPDRLIAHGLDVNAIKSLIQEREFDRSLGRLDLKVGGQYQVTEVLEDETIEDLRQIIVADTKGLPLRLDDVANIELKEELPDRFFKGSGRRSLILGGQPKPDANIQQISETFLDTIKREAKAIDPEIKVEVLLNPATFINTAVRAVLHAVLMGVMIATLVIFLFLGTMKSTIIVSTSIPLSLIGGFVLMKLLDIEINLISLGAMALAVGMVVDGAIIVLENITRHLEETRPRSRRERLTVVLKSVDEVRGAIIASLLTTIIVFAPLPFTAPLASAVLGDLAVVVVCVLVASVFVTLFVIPPLVMALRYNVGQKHRRNGLYAAPKIFCWVFEKAQQGYIKSLGYLLERRWAATCLVAVVAGLAALSALILVTEVPREIMAKPHTDKVFLYMNIKGEELDIWETEKLVNIYEQQIMDEFGDDLSHIVSRIQTGSPWILAILKDKSKIDEMKKAFEETLKNTPRVNFHINDWNPTSLKIPNPPLLHIFVGGRNESARRETLVAIQDELYKNESVGWVQTFPQTYKDNYLRLETTKETLLRLPNGMASTIESNIRGIVTNYLGEQYVKEMMLDGEPAQVKIKIDEGFIKSPGDLENLLIRIDDKKVVPLRAFADIQHVRDWSHYYSENGRNITAVKVWAKESFKGDKDALAAELRQQLAENKNIDMTKLTFADTQAEINGNIQSLARALVLALLLVCIVITLQFGSLTQTAIVMLAVPFGFIGVAFSLWGFSSTLSVNSMLGTILLCGTAVNNSILFVDFFNQLRHQNGQSVKSALLETAALRFRPIMITTCTTVLGMLPIAVGYGSGGEILQPLGIAVCGGLWISTLLTILLVPLSLQLAEGLKEFAQRRFGTVEAKAAALFLTFAASGFAAFTTGGPARAAEADGTTAGLVYSLEGAITRALAHHPELKAARHSLAIETAKYRSSYAPLLPTVKVGRRYSEGNVFNEAAEETLRFKQGVNSLSIEETIGNPYRQLNSIKIAELEKVSADSKAVELRQDLIGRVRLAYFQLKAAETLLENARQNLKTAEETRDTMERRFREGFITGSDVARARIHFMRVAATLEERRQAVNSAHTRLMHLMGVPESACPCRFSTSLPDSFAYFSFDRPRLAALAAKSDNQSLRQLELAAESARLALNNARFGFLPDITIGATFTRQDPNQEPFEPRGPTYFAALEWTLFDGGQRYYDAGAAQARLLATEATLMAARLDLDTTVETTIDQLLAVKETFRTSQDIYKALEEIVAESRQRFARGLISAKDVNDDLSDFLAAEEALVNYKVTIIENLVNLSQATGNLELFEQLL